MHDVCEYFLSESALSQVANTADSKLIELTDMITAT